MMAEIEDIESIKQALQKGHGVITTRLGTVVRSFPPYQNCTQMQVNKVIAELLNEGITHFPPELVADQNTVVGLYTLSGPSAELIEAVLKPTEDSGTTLRSASIFNDALNCFYDTI